MMLAIMLAILQDKHVEQSFSLPTGQEVFLLYFCVDANFSCIFMRKAIPFAWSNRHVSDPSKLARFSSWTDGVHLPVPNFFSV
jgi:hypothetical protein